jgi:hypothetical protein
LDLRATEGADSTFLTGGRTAKRLISDLGPGEVLKAMLRPMPHKPHARVTIATWVDRKSWSTPEPISGVVQLEPEPIIDSGLLIDDLTSELRPARISELAPDETPQRISRKPFRAGPRGEKIASLES